MYLLIYKDMISGISYEEHCFTRGLGKRVYELTNNEDTEILFILPLCKTFKIFLKCLKPNGDKRVWREL